MQIDGETMENSDFIFSGSKITADGHQSHEIKRHFLLGRKAIVILGIVIPRQHIKKQRHYFANKGCIVKAMVFLVVMNGCVSWTIKKAEHRRIDAFELRCWRRLLRVPWTPGGSNQSILKEINPECSLEGLLLKLKLQYFGHLMWRIDSLRKTLMLGKIEGRREGDNKGWDGWMASPTQRTWVWASSGRWWGTRKPGVLQSVWLQRVGHDWVTEQQGLLWHFSSAVI